MNQILKKIKKKDVEKIILNIVKRVLKKDISVNYKFLKHGVDSLGMIKIILQIENILEKKYQLQTNLSENISKVDSKRIFETPKSIIRFINKKLD